MKRFIGFIRKEFYHIFRDKRSLFILFGMPIAQILLFGFAITNEINNVEIAILDYAKDTESQKIIQKIKASPYFHVENEIFNEKAIESEFKKGKVKAVLLFEKDFAKKLQTEKKATVQVITDESTGEQQAKELWGLIAPEHFGVLNRRLKRLYENSPKVAFPNQDANEDKLTNQVHF